MISVVDQGEAQVMSLSKSKFNFEVNLARIQRKENIFIFFLGVTGTYEPIERLKERQGKGMAEAKALETPSKRTKKTDKAKLVRQVNILKRYCEEFKLFVKVLITDSFLSIHFDNFRIPT